MHALPAVILLVTQHLLVTQQHYVPGTAASLCRWGTCSTEKLSDLPGVTQLVRGPGSI